MLTVRNQRSLNVRRMFISVSKADHTINRNSVPMHPGIRMAALLRTRALSVNGPLGSSSLRTTLLSSQTEQVDESLSGSMAVRVRRRSIFLIMMALRVSSRQPMMKFTSTMAGIKVVWRDWHSTAHISLLLCLFAPHAMAFSLMSLATCTVLSKHVIRFSAHRLPALQVHSAL